MMCLEVDLFVFILFGIHWASWICRYSSFVKFGTFSAIISSNTFPALHFFSSPSEAPMTKMLDFFVMIPQISKALFTFPIFFFLSLWCSDWITFIGLSSSSLIISSVTSILLLSWPMEVLFLFMVTLFISLKFPFGSCLCLLFIWHNFYFSFCFKSDNSNIFVISPMVFWLSFPMQVEIFLVVHMPSSF